MTVAATAHVRPPGQEAFRRYSSDLLRLPGVAKVRYDALHPGELTLYMRTTEFARLADNVLRDTVAGAKLVFEPLEGATPTPGGWFDDPTEMVRVVGGLRGVHDQRYEFEAGSVAFFTTSSKASQQLRGLVSEHLGPWRSTFVDIVPR